MVTPGEYYQHHEGGVYKVIAIALHHDSLNPFVVFKAVAALDPYAKGTVWIRPEQVFRGYFTKNGVLTKRYTRLSRKNLLLWKIKRAFSVSSCSLGRSKIFRLLLLLKT